MDPIQAYLETLKQGGKQNHLNLTMIPLLAANEGEPDYLTLEEGLGQGIVTITEVSTGGSLPELKLINKSADKILLLPFLIAGLTEIIIPVSCVEQGRWNYRSRTFAHGEKILPPSLKRENLRNVAFNLEQGAGYRSNQGMIWDEIEEKSKRMKVKSSTMAMADLFEGQKDHLGEYVKAFHLVDSQVGAIFAINGKVVGLECFGHWQTFSKFFKKLIQSYALDAIDMYEEVKTDRTAAGDIRGFMEGIQKAPRKSYASLGLGENIRAEGPFVSGASLVLKENFLHFSAFVHDGNKNEEPRIPYQRFSQRRRRT